jgi:GNAT superfamily N-acetyltransferase
MVTYQQEFMCMAEQEIAPLAELEWEESGHPTETLCIDWERYFDFEEQGILKFFTARDEGKLVGYFVVIYSVPFTTVGSPLAVYDAAYVDREYRGIGRKLFAFVEKCVKEDGIHRVLASSSVKNPIGNLLERMGYQEIETKYEKVI